MDEIDRAANEVASSVQPFLIEQILPSRQIHLLGGPTGAGKSRWLFQMILKWQSGLPILGKKSYPVPWVYVAADRDTDAMKRTLEDMQIDPAQVPFIPAWEKNMSPSQIFDAADEMGAKLILFEAFGSFVEPPGNRYQVKNYINATYRICREGGFTIMGVMESPKMKPKDCYQNPRQRISGVASWGHFTETIFLMEPVNPEDPSCPDRKFYCCPRVGQGIVLDAKVLPPHGIWDIL